MTAPARLLLTGAAFLLLLGCGGGGGDGSAAPSFTVGVTVAGLEGSGLTLRNNGGNTLAISGNGAFVFSSPVATNSSYAVTVQSQPLNPAQTCSINNGNGSVAGANVTNVQVVCGTNTYTIGGTVTGLVGTGLVLQNNGDDSVPVAADGTFIFPQQIRSGVAYAVSVAIQPTASPPWACAVSNGTGVVGSTSVTSVAVSCGLRPAGFVYIPNNISATNTLSAFSIDASTGLLTVVPGSPFAAGLSPRSVVTDPGKKYLYVPSGGFQTSHKLSAFSISYATGALTSLAGSPHTLTQNAPDIGRPLIDPLGKFLYAVSNQFTNAPTLFGFSINSLAGNIAALPGSPYASPSTPAVTMEGQGVFSIDGRFLYRQFNDSSNGLLETYAVDRTSGGLTFLESTQTQTANLRLIVHPTGKFLFGLNFLGELSAYMINSATGQLTWVFRGPSWPSEYCRPADMQLHPSGNFLLLTRTSVAHLSAPCTSSIWVLRIDPATGALTHEPGSPFATSMDIFDAAGTYGADGQLQITPDGKYLYALNGSGSPPLIGTHIGAYRFDENTGLITEISGSPFSVPGGLEVLRLGRSGKNLYGTHSNDALKTFSVNAQNGALTLEQSLVTPWPYGLKVVDLL